MGLVAVDAGLKPNVGPTGTFTRSIRYSASLHLLPPHRALTSLRLKIQHNGRIPAITRSYKYPTIEVGKSTSVGQLKQLIRPYFLKRLSRPSSSPYFDGLSLVHDRAPTP